MRRDGLRPALILFAASVVVTTCAFAWYAVHRQDTAARTAEAQRKAICAILANIPGRIPPEIHAARSVFARPGHPHDCYPRPKAKPHRVATATPAPTPGPPQSEPAPAATASPRPTPAPSRHPSRSPEPRPSPTGTRSPTPAPTCLLILCISPEPLPWTTSRNPPACPVLSAITTRACGPPGRRPAAVPVPGW